MIWRDCACCATAHPPGMDIAAGEYGYDLRYFRRMLQAGAVDVLQADATRCAGFTEFLKVDALCEARCMPLSSHCAPILHLHVVLRQLARASHGIFPRPCAHRDLLFDGVPVPGRRHAPSGSESARPGSGVQTCRRAAIRHLTAADGVPAADGAIRHRAARHASDGSLTADWHPLASDSGAFHDRPDRDRVWFRSARVPVSDSTL